jgi:hypothetical protein
LSNNVCNVVKGTKHMGIDARPKVKCLEWFVRFVLKVEEIVTVEGYRT